MHLSASQTPAYRYTNIKFQKQFLLKNRDPALDHYLDECDESDDDEDGIIKLTIDRKKYDELQKKYDDLQKQFDELKKNIDKKPVEKPIIKSVNKVVIKAVKKPVKKPVESESESDTDDDLFTTSKELSLNLSELNF